MSVPVIIQLVTVIAAATVAGLCISKWQYPRMMYFTCYALFATLMALGYLFEITAPTLEAAVVACKLCYLGSPFVGVFYYLFVRDYCDAPIRQGRWVLLLSLYPLFISLLVQSWPLQTLYYSGLSFNTSGSFSRLVVSPGPLYVTSFIYSTLMAVLGLIAIFRYFRRTGKNGRRHILVFFIATSGMFVAQIIFSLGIIPGGFDPIPLAITLNLVFMYWYLTHYRQREWLTFGREAVLQSMKDAFILTDGRGRFVDANDKAHAYFPTMARAKPGQLMSDIADLPTGLLQNSGEDDDFTLTQNGETLFLRISRSPLVVDGNELGTSIMIYDDTENHHLMEKLQQLATHDTLTNLYNRGTFFTFATRDFDLSLRKREAGSVLMLDIDHFKNVNDLHGHACGDKVLVSVARILLDRLRHTDISGRYGGEELAVWLPGAATEGASIIADVIRRAVEHTTFESDAGRFNVTVSIGVAGIDYSRHQSFDDLVDEADTALYQAKRGGRNRVCIYVHDDASRLAATQ